MPIITLLTDFGLSDTYVGQVKGAVLSIANAADLVDLTHGVPPQDVRAGAFLLWSAVDAFPPGSIHVAVVDPGVGSPRRGLALSSTRGDLFVGPDNGLLIPAVERLGGVQTAINLTERRYWRPATSSTSSSISTFHGRDVFGPVAAHLANGLPIDRLGPPVSDVSRAAGWPAPEGLNGEVIHADAYGNLVTNVARAGLPASYEVIVGRHRVRNGDYYAAVAPGELVALVGSANLLEISARDASAANITGARRGTPLRVVEV